MINWIASFMLKLVCALCEYNYNILIENCVTVCRYGEEMATAIIDTAHWTSTGLPSRTSYHPALCFSSSVIFHLVDACVGLNWLLVSFLSHVNKNIIHSFIHSFIHSSIALVKGTALSPLDCTLLSTAYIQFLQLYNY